MYVTQNEAKMEKNIQIFKINFKRIFFKKLYEIIVFYSKKHKNLDD